jgi:hypothetical protein
VRGDETGIKVQVLFADGLDALAEQGLEGGNLGIGALGRGADEQDGGRQEPAIS